MSEYKGAKDHQKGNNDMKKFCNPNDFLNTEISDSEAINLAVKEAKLCGCNSVLISPKTEGEEKEIWNISEAIILPSDIEIVIDNCCLRQSDGAFDNIFRTENALTGNKESSLTELRNIHIRGKGYATLDGGLPNGLTEQSSETQGYPHIIKNNMILITNTRGFSISGILFRDMRWWAVNLIHASCGKLENLSFYAKDNIPNQDGIDLRIGCHDIEIENVFGTAGDDLIALSGFLGFERDLGFEVDGKSPDIKNVSIKNIHGTSVSKAVIAIRNHDGVRVENVTIDGVFDTSHETGNHPYAILRIGQKTYSNYGFSKLHDTRCIVAKNIHASSGDVVMVNVTLEDSCFENLFLNNSARTAFTTGSDWMPPGATMKNITICGVSDMTNKATTPLIELKRENTEEFIENLKIGSVKYATGRSLIYSEYDGTDDIVNI